MKIILGLHVISTGEEILRQETTQSARSWQGNTEGKISRRKNRAQRYRDAIANQDTIVSWVNFDDCIRQGYSPQEMGEAWDHIFKTYENYFDQRMELA